MTLTLPAELSDQLREKASVLGASLDSTVAVLLEYGLGVQRQREREIAELANTIVSSQDACERNAASEKLGETIFG